MLKVFVLTALLVLPGCSMIDALRAMSPNQPALSVDAQVGKEANKQAIVGDQRKQEVEIEVEQGDVDIATDNRKVDTAFDGDVRTDEISVTNFPPHLIYILILLCIIGWMLPTPTNMWKGFWRFVWRPTTTNAPQKTAERSMNDDMG